MRIKIGDSFSIVHVNLFFLVKRFLASLLWRHIHRLSWWRCLHVLWLAWHRSLHGHARRRSWHVDLLTHWRLYWHINRLRRRYYYWYFHFNCLFNNDLFLSMMGYYLNVSLLLFIFVLVAFIADHTAGNTY